MAIKKWLFLALFVPSLAQAYVNLSGAFWSNGGYKIPLEDQWPNATCSSCTLGLNWDGTTAKAYGFKNEIIGGQLVLQGGSANATSVSVSLSPLVGPGSSVISSTAVLCANVTDYTTRDFEVFVATYSRLKGMSELTYNAPPVDERDLATNYRNPYTVNSDNDGVSNSPNIYATRPIAGKMIPAALIPQECLSNGFTVYKSSSQTVWIDILLSSSLVAGTYTGTITVNEGVTVSTTIPINVTVWNASLPNQPSYPVMAYMSEDDINYRLNGIAHNAGCSTTPCVNTDNAFYIALHRHRMFSAGDQPDASTNDFPSTRYQAQIDGSLFTSAHGYRGPGTATGVPDYSIGTYGHWRDNGNWSQTDANAFAVQSSSWGAWFKANAPTVRSFVYLDDEPSTTTLANTVNRWSTWLSTVPAAQVSGYTVHSWVTSAWPLTKAYSPYLDNSVTGEWIDKKTTFADWKNSTSTYLTQGSTQGWSYNGGPPFTGTQFSDEEDGIGAWVNTWEDMAYGVKGHFLWQTTNWYNPGSQSPAENRLWGEDGLKTFGFDAFPSTSTTKGRFGLSYGNGDGVMFYPGTEVSTYTAANLGFLGPVASIRLKYARRGINDADYITMARAVDPVATNAIVNTMIGNIGLWNITCFDPADCSYAFGGRQWDQNPDDWEQARINLAAIILGGLPSNKATVNGNVTIKGNVQFK